MNEQYGPKEFEDLTVSELVQADLVNRTEVQVENGKPTAWNEFLVEHEVPLERTTPVRDVTGSATQDQGKILMTAATFTHFKKHPDRMVHEVAMARNGSEWSTDYRGGTRIGPVGAGAIALQHVLEAVASETAANGIDDAQRGNHPFRNPTDESYLSGSMFGSSGASSARREWQGSLDGGPLRVGGIVHQ